MLCFEVKLGAAWKYEYEKNGNKETKAEEYHESWGLATPRY